VQVDNSDFFNNVSAFYDEMINFERSIERRIAMLSEFNPLGNALDLGCGTGLDSISLAKLGCNVTACDQSAEMIYKAKLNAIKHNVNINFIESPVQNISQMTDKKFDVIVSLGNTLANLNSKQISVLLKSLPDMMNEKYRIIFQIVNFSLMPESGEYLVNRFENEKQIIKRFYTVGSSIYFNIEFIDKISNQSKIITTQIFPYEKKFFTKSFEETGIEIKFFGGMDLSDYNPETSKDLVIVSA
jgi:ubiquinone/menaquinone biosynthesis C-methylase UbiE